MPEGFAVLIDDTNKLLPYYTPLAEASQIKLLEVASLDILRDYVLVMRQLHLLTLPVKRGEGAL